MSFSSLAKYNFLVKGIESLGISEWKFSYSCGIQYPMSSKCCIFLVAAFLESCEPKRPQETCKCLLAQRYDYPSQIFRTTISDVSTRHYTIIVRYTTCNRDQINTEGHKILTWKYHPLWRGKNTRDSQRNFIISVEVTNIGDLQWWSYPVRRLTKDIYSSGYLG